MGRWISGCREQNKLAKENGRREKDEVSWDVRRVSSL